MVSKLKFLGVAEATWARVAAKVATWAKAVANTATKFTAARAESLATAAILAKSAKKFTAATFATLTAAVCFAGCDEAKDLADSAKSLAASVSIEQPTVSIESEYYNSWLGDGIREFVKVQSKDNNTVIEGINANRGNCATLKYEIDDKKLKAYGDANPDKVLLNGGTQLQTTSGQLIKPKDKIYADDLGYYESLNEQSKATYRSFFPAKMPFGEIEKYYQGFFKCKIDTIIEIELAVNGGSLSYSFEQGY